MFLKNKNIIFKIRRPKVTDYVALKRVGFWSIFTYENIHCKLLSFINPAGYLLNVIYGAKVMPNKVIFPEKEDERNFCLCSGIYAYFS